MQNNRLVLEFSNGQRPELISTLFSHSLLSTTIRCVRGKSAGAFDGCGSFQWTKAVKAIAAIFLLTQQSRLTAGKQSRGSIAGHKGSLAASLDYALDKQPLWLVDMFGIDSRGTALVKRMLRRSNPGRKRAGPATLALNEGFLNANCIELCWESGRSCSYADLQEILNQIISQDTETACQADEQRGKRDLIQMFGDSELLPRAA